jgi:multiple sugar transport system permease protein
MIFTFYLSLTNWDGLSLAQAKFIGLSNYQRLFDDDIFSISLANNIKWILVFITVPTTAGLALALALNRAIPGEKFLKISFYLPLVLATSVAAIIWSWLFNPSTGLINSFLALFSIEGPQWLGREETALLAVLIVGVWRQVGYVMVLYLAGLKNIDPQLIDASKVDGAGSWDVFKHVIFPLLGPITVIVVVISIIDSLRSFDLVNVMTRGGPSYASNVLANFMFIESFTNYKMGYGAAIAVILFLLSAVFIFIYLWRTLKTEMEY